MEKQLIQPPSKTPKVNSNQLYVYPQSSPVNELLETLPKSDTRDERSAISANKLAIVGVDVMEPIKIQNFSFDEQSSRQKHISAKNSKIDLVSSRPSLRSCTDLKETEEAIREISPAVSQTKLNVDYVELP